MEKRQIQTPIEFKTDDESEVIEGYALKTDVFSNPMPILDKKFKEIIQPGALDNTDLSNVVALFNHDRNQVLGRIGANLTLETDDTGLKYRIAPVNTTLFKDLIENVKAGLINASSFHFEVEPGGDSWYEVQDDDADYVHVVSKIKQITDVSVVTAPAYNEATAGVSQRSVDGLTDMVSFRKNRINNLKKSILLNDLRKKETL